MKQLLGPCPGCGVRLYTDGTTCADRHGLRRPWSSPVQAPIEMPIAGPGRSCELVRLRPPVLRNASAHAVRLVIGSVLRWLLPLAVAVPVIIAELVLAAIVHRYVRSAPTARTVRR